MRIVLHHFLIAVISLAGSMLATAQDAPALESISIQEKAEQSSIASNKEDQIPRAGYYHGVDESYAVVRLYILGDKPFWLSRTDTVRVRFGFQNKGPKLLEPTMLGLSIYTESSDRMKYRDDHTVTISADGVTLLTATPEMNDDWTTTITMKSFRGLNLPYKDFVKMLEAKKVEFRIGKTVEIIKPDGIQGLIGLNNKIQR